MIQRENIPEDVRKVASRLYRLHHKYATTSKKISQKYKRALIDYLLDEKTSRLAAVAIKHWDILFPGDYGSFIKFLKENNFTMYFDLEEGNKKMKITNEFLKELIRESLSEIERIDPREDPEGVYGVDPGGEMSDEVEEERESELVDRLERVIADLSSIVSEFRSVERSEKNK